MTLHAKFWEVKVMPFGRVMKKTEMFCESGMFLTAGFSCFQNIWHTSHSTSMCYYSTPGTCRRLMVQSQGSNSSTMVLLSGFSLSLSSGPHGFVFYTFLLESHFKPFYRKYFFLSLSKFIFLHFNTIRRWKWEMPAVFCANPCIPIVL